MRTRVVVCVALILGSVARADDIEQAEALFKEGRTLLAAGKVSEACAKFEASLRLNPQAIGTLLSAASCDEKRGRIATAASRYRQARDMGREMQQDRVIEDAQKKLAAIEGLVPHLTITISQRLPGMKLVIDERAISIDDKSIPVDGVGVRDLPIDPGDHTIVVSAPSRLPFDYKFSIVQSESKTVAIPVLAAPVKNTRKTIGVIVGASGIATVGGGIILAELAKNKYDSQFKAGNTAPANCDKATKLCNTQGQLNVNSARFQGDIATGLVIVGAAAIVTGGVLWFTAPRQPTETKLAVMPQVSSDQIGIVAAGRF